MPLPAPQSRSLLHTRNVTYRGYVRDDGLWDIEGELLDTKAYVLDRHEMDVPAGTPVHRMAIRATVDDSMTIREMASSMDYKPFDECLGSQDPMQAMVGVTMGPGWRKNIDRAMGGTRGCTHLRELLFNMATAAYQTIPNYQERLRKQAGLPEDESAEPPHHLGKCLSWAFDGRAVQQHYPQFAGWQPLKRMDKGPAST